MRVVVDASMALAWFLPGSPVRKEKFGREMNGRTYDAMPVHRVIPIYASASA